MGTSSFLSRWTSRPEPGEGPDSEPGRNLPESLPTPEGRNQGTPWSVSPSLERLCQEFDEQVRVIQEAKRLIEERMGPFQQYLLEQRRNVDQALNQLESRIKPLRQYLEGQEHNLERVGAHLNTELKEQFEAFGKFLADQRQILDRASRFLEEQPRPLVQYLEDQRRAIEHVFREVEEQLEPFAGHLREQQELLEAMADPRITEEFRALANLCGERQAALERYAAATEYRPQVLFAELDQLHQKYASPLDGGRGKLLDRVLEQTRESDLRLQDALKPLPRERDEPYPPRVEAAP
ncbi:MAG TPA: hypothetical protein VLT62_13015 [Candidatus Methylomirabilis sp.]|nr:hypothetical protein [Candidatus Methylomirabilis sp.]